jgi:hypothetical protein
MIYKILRHFAAENFLYDLCVIYLSPENWIGIFFKSQPEESSYSIESVLTTLLREYNHLSPDLTDLNLVLQFKKPP